MKRILLSLILLFVAAATISAQVETVQTEPPVIVCDVDEWLGVANIFAYGEGEIHLYVDGNEVENPFSIASPDCYGWTMDVVAMAHVDGQIDGYATAVCTIPDATTLMGDIVIGDVEEDGRVFVAYIGGNEPVSLYVTVNGVEAQVVNNYVTVGEGESVIDVTVSGGRTCQMEGQSKTVTYTPSPIEQTAAPVITVQGPNIDLYPDVLDVFTTVFIENDVEDSYADIYYAITNQWDDEYVNWMIYDGPLSFYPGEYFIKAYAVAPGKAPSEIVNITFFAMPVPELVYLYDFIVDGIYYRYRGSDEVWVTTEGLESHDYNPWPHPHSLCYSGDVVIPESVEYEGKTYRVTGIYHEAFWGCKVTSLDLPATMTEIGECNFNNSPDDPKYFVCRAITPPEVAENYYGNHFGNGQTLFVPAESLQAYRVHSVWKNFGRIVPFLGAGPGDVNGDGKIAISDVTGVIGQLLDSYDIPAYYDVNGDGKVTIADVTALIDKLLNSN